jgi:hypothetical protein
VGNEVALSYTAKPFHFSLFLRFYDGQPEKTRKEIDCRVAPVWRFTTRPMWTGSTTPVCGRRNDSRSYPQSSKDDSEIYSTDPRSMDRHWRTTMKGTMAENFMLFGYEDFWAFP